MINDNNNEKYYYFAVRRCNVSHICINQYNWKGTKFPSDKEDWEKFEQNDKEIALNILFVPHNKKEICHAYI